MKQITKLVKTARALSDAEYDKFYMNVNSAYTMYLEGTSLLVRYKIKGDTMQVEVKLDEGKFTGAYSQFFIGQPSKKEFIHCLVVAIEEMFKLMEDYDKRKNSL